jgi:hypothetical protein
MSKWFIPHTMAVPEHGNTCMTERLRYVPALISTFNPLISRLKIAVLLLWDIGYISCSSYDMELV